MQDVQGRRIQGDQGVLKQRRRSLQQVGDVTVVETADALQEAVVAGMAHIEIRAHLDLTEHNSLHAVPKAVQSIRVRH